MSDYSIIVPNYNGLQMLSQCLLSMMKTTRNFEVIVVDNGSTDGSVGYLKDMVERYGHVVKAIFNEENRGFAHALNQGLEIAKGDFLVWLNNDTVLTPNWAEQLRFAMNNAQQVKNLDRVGLVGPATNAAAGRQQVRDSNGRPPQYSLANLDEFSERAHKQNPNNWYDTGFLSGFCLMMKREVYEKVGPVEDWSEFTSEGNYNPGGYEDNDYVLRAWLAGYRSLIAADTFIHHFGSVTIRKFPEMRGGVANGDLFLKKWKKIFNKESAKLIAGMRIKWTQKEAPLGNVLDGVMRFADGIVIVDNEMSKEDRAIVDRHPGVLKVVETKGLDERRDRNILIDLARERGGDWMISVDADEIFEDKFDRAYVERLMRPPWPQMLSYCFHWYTFWNTTNQWRVDGTFGGIAGARMFRLTPGLKIVLGNEQGFHCGNIPNHPPEFVRWTNVRIKHYGYIDPEERKRKYQWYEKNDTDKRPELIGGTNYSHLIQPRVEVAEWKEDNGLTLCMMGSNEEEFVLDALRQYWGFVDKIVFVDTGSTDRTKELALLAGAEVYDFEWKDDFAAARNFANSKVSSAWVWHMDPDEDFPMGSGAFPELRRIMDKEFDCILFSFQNLHPTGAVTFSENIRMFRNIPQLWFEGCAHETFDKAIERDGRIRTTKTTFSVTHKGYLRARDRVAGKMKYYYDLNMKQIKKDPKDVRAMHSIATHLLNIGKMNEAMEWLIRADLIRPSLLVKRNLAQIYARLASDKCREALATCAILRDEDRGHLEQFIRAMDPFKFVNVPVPHEGEKEVRG